MIIHVVQPGETIYSIAERYKISAARLVQDNGLTTPNNLVVGQTIVIVYPEQTYTVQEGDSLIGIADAHGVTLMQLLRNNPYLSDREFIYPGETIVVRYSENKSNITTNGYAYPFINEDILRKTLPFLTYLSIFNYRATAEGGIIGIDDTEIIQIAKEYGVAPIMLLTTLSSRGEANLEVAFSILYNQEIQDRHIENMLNILKTKGYYGVNITFQYINVENQLYYTNFLIKITNRLNSEGYPVFVTINPSINYENGFTFEKVDYAGIGQAADGVTFLSYDWGYSFGPPTPIAFSEVREFLDYAITKIPTEKIYAGLPVIGYDWQLPYEKGISRANSLNADSAISLASNVNAIIQYDAASQAPYFMYVDDSSGIPTQHIVWFKDARSIDAMVKLVEEYGFRGISIWNIMYFFSQMWLVINSQYQIEKLEPEIFT